MPFLKEIQIEFATHPPFPLEKPVVHIFIKNRRSDTSIVAVRHEYRVMASPHSEPPGHLLLVASCSHAPSKPTRRSMENDGRSTACPAGFGVAELPLPLS